MNTTNQVIDKEIKMLTPVIRRLLNKPLLSRGRGGQVMSLKKRQKLMLRDEEHRKFLQEHPWWKEIQGFEREIIRRFICREEPRDAAVQAELVEWFVFTAGDSLGKEVIWPILNHLVEGGGFHAEGMEIRGLDRPSQPSPSISFLEFLSRHAPAGTGAGRIEVVRMLLKARKRLKDLVSQARRNGEGLAKE